jgi:Protein of unknown function (DUF1614)
MLIAPLAVAVIAAMLDPQERAPLAYIGSTLGVLIGADLMRLKGIRKLGARDRKSNGLCRSISPTTGPIKGTNSPSCPPEEAKTGQCASDLGSKRARKEEREGCRRLTTDGPTALAPGCCQLTC